MSLYADVILPLAIQDTYTYSVPDGMQVEAGMRVVVPLVKKQMTGIVRRLHTDLPAPLQADHIRPIIAPLDTMPVVTCEQLRLWQWISDYYLCPIGDVLAAALPRKVLDKQYSFQPTARRRVRLPHFTGELKQPSPLTEQQQRAKADILHAWQTKRVTLLYGVTSSGKTEVYIHLIEEQLQQGKQVLYLVPEIALTTQLTDRLQSVFGDRLIVYHSRVSDTLRAETYRHILNPPTSQTGQLIVGARSAVFLPFRQLGMVIVDEEHETSYKQQDPAPRYHARSVAIMLGEQMDAHVLLGTATPALETLYNVQNGKYGLSRMNERFQGLQLPRITLIDLNRQYHRKEMYGHFSDPLVARIEEELQKNKQIILFQNRRGFAPYIQCTACGRVPSCPSCDVSMTLHRNLRGQYLQCHYCGYEMPVSAACPECGGQMHVHGFGTERIEDEVARFFPTARVARLDFDSTRKKETYQDIIRSFSTHEIDILIGTQMVSKGLHFDDVSLVAVLNADSLFNQPSYRSYERAFQMLEQVAGRAGRKGQQGEVILQTFDPQHPIFQHLQAHDYDRFYQWQMEERQQFRFPPFTHLITLTVKHKAEEKALQAANRLQSRLAEIFGTRCSGVMQPSITRLQNYHLRTIQLRIEQSGSFGKARQLLRDELNQLTHTKEGRNAIIQTDIDPCE